MNSDDKLLFDNYARHYESMGKDRLLDDIARLRRDRLPEWLN